MEEFKKQAHKEFDSFRIVLSSVITHEGHRTKVLKELEELKQTTDSLIDKTVQMSEERIVGVIEGSILKSDYKYDKGTLDKLISLITNKSDINK